MPPPTYGDYLSLDRLLALQQGLGEDEADLSSDELQFVVVHQIYELWFKLVLRELRTARDVLGAPEVPEDQIPLVVHHVGRVNRILRIAVQQFEVMESMTPQDFLNFRDKLVPASGFQSFQMREIEIVLGLDREERSKHGLPDPLLHLRNMDGVGADMAAERIDKAEAETTLLRALEGWLVRTPIQGSRPGMPNDEQAVADFIADYLSRANAHGKVQAQRHSEVADVDRDIAIERQVQGQEAAVQFLEARDVDGEDQARTRRVRAALLFIESYRELPLLTWPRTLLDGVVELEQQLLLWRHRHARMVERVIGRRSGTGGSAGVDYLDRTSRCRIFRDLWQVRTLLLPRATVPPLLQPEVYGFATPTER